jgi:TRAP-type C4-dicarboxylate transport system substrate-binding protein
VCQVLVRGLNIPRYGPCDLLFRSGNGLSIGCPHGKCGKRKRPAAEEMIQPDEPLGTVSRKTALAQAWLSGSIWNAPIVDASGSRVVMRVTGHPPANAFIVTGIWKPAFLVLERMTAGRIKVQDCWGAVVHGDREGAAALRAGRTDMALCYSPWDPASFPLAQVLGLPGLFPTAEVATHVAEAIYWDYLRADVERQDLRMGRLKATGAYSLFSKEPIRRLEDMAGCRIGCSEGPEMEVFAALGARPMPVSSLEMRPAFASGALDAVSIADASASVFGIDRIARFRSAPNLLRLNMEFCLNREYWRGLPHDLQDSLHLWFRALAQAETQVFYGLGGAMARENFVKRGMTFVQFDGEERARCMARVAHLADRFVTTNEAAGRPAAKLLADVHTMVDDMRDRGAEALMNMALGTPIQRINARS